MKRILAAVLAMLTGAACANHPGRSEYHARKRDEAAYQRGLAQAVADARDQDRQPASGETLRARINPAFAQLRQEFKMVVFPKSSNITEKNSDAEQVLFAKPQTFTFHAQRLLACSDLAKQNVKGLSNRQVFKSLAGADKSLSCAAIHVFRTDPALRPATYRNDLIGMTFYLDSEYRAYGLDTEIAHDRKSIRRVTLRQNPAEPLSSGLALFPVDLPSPSAAAKAQDGPMQIPADAYVQNQMKKQGAAPGCAQGTVFNYRDAYGNPARVGWCAGSRWPSVIETNRYFAVIKTKN